MIEAPLHEVIPVRCGSIEMVRTDSLKPHPCNPNTHPERQIAVLAKMIAYHGWRLPITVSNRSGFVVRGHARLMAAKRLGLEMVPVDRQDYKDEADEHGDLYGDNKISEYAELDGAMESELLGKCKEIGFDVELAGIPFREAEKMLEWNPEGGSSPQGAGGEGGGDPIPKHECPKCGFRW